MESLANKDYTKLRYFAIEYWRVLYFIRGKVISLWVAECKFIKCINQIDSFFLFFQKKILYSLCSVLPKEKKNFYI